MHSGVLLPLWCSFFHIFESFATSPLDQVINHGYLAVDFFFMLSGFVIAYAYDDRWDILSVKNFCKRRLIRLQPIGGDRCADRGIVVLHTRLPGVGRVAGVDRGTTGGDVAQYANDTSYAFGRNTRYWRDVPTQWAYVVVVL
jgi:acyltransferase